MALKVQHLVRWSPQDWRTCRVRGRSATTADPMLRIVYLECLFALYESGGSLSPDPEVLADVCMLPAEEIARCLPSLLRIGESGRGGLYIEDGALRNRRVTEDIEEELEYRLSAKEHGRRGGRPPAPEHETKKGGPKGTLSDPKGTPRARARPHAPPPPPSPTPTPPPEDPPTHPAGARGEREHTVEAGAPPPSPPVVVGGVRPPNGNRPEPGRLPPPGDPADEAACAAFGDALLAAWPAGHVNPVRYQRALHDVWSRGLIRRDGSEPTAPKSRTAAQVLADMPLWQAYHDSGARPKHAETYLEQLCFLAPVPQPLKSRSEGSGALASTRKRWGSDLAPGTTLADIEAAREFDLQVFGPRESLDG